MYINITSHIYLRKVESITILSNDKELNLEKKIIQAFFKDF